MVLHATRFAFYGWPVLCKSRFGGTTCEVGFGTQLQLPVWCTITDHKDWNAFVLDYMPPIWSLAQSELPHVVMTVVETKVPLLQRLARLGFNGITVTILNRLLKDVPKEFLKVKPCTAVEKVCALIAWTLKGTGDHDLQKLLAGWFDRRVPTKPLIQKNAAFSDEILDPDSKKDLQNEHKKIEEQDTSFCIMYWLCVFAVLVMHCCPWFACVAVFFCICY